MLERSIGKLKENLGFYIATLIAGAILSTFLAVRYFYNDLYKQEISLLNSQSEILNTKVKDLEAQISVTESSCNIRVRDLKEVLTTQHTQRESDLKSRSDEIISKECDAVEKHNSNISDQLFEQRQIENKLENLHEYLRQVNNEYAKIKDLCSGEDDVYKYNEGYRSCTDEAQYKADIESYKAEIVTYIELSKQLSSQIQNSNQKNNTN